MKLDQNVSKIQTVCLLILTGVAIGLTLWWLSGVLIPFVVAVLLSVCLSPVRQVLMRRLHLPQAIAVAVSLLLVLLVIGGIGFVATAAGVELSRNLGTYTQKIDKLTEEVESWPIFERFTSVEPEKEKATPGKGEPKTADQNKAEPSEKGGATTDPIEPDPVVPQPGKDGAPESAPAQSDADPGESGTPGLQVDSTRKKLDLGKIIDPAFVGQLFVDLMNAVMGLLSQATVVLLYLLFLMLGQELSDRPDSQLWSDVKGRIRAYLLLKGVLSTLTGLLVWAILAWLEVDLALVFGLFSFLLNFVPSIGSIIATLLPVPIVLMSDELSLSAQILAIVLPGTVQFVVGNVLEPKLMGESLDLHPVTILLALITWGMLWGVLGVLLAVPLTAALKILFERLDATAPVARVMSGRFGPA